jgi:RNA polymerase sigma-70 factor (ECF subfamily)
MAKSAHELLPTRYSLLSRLHDWDDQQSWKEFFDTYWRLIYGLARRAGLSEVEAQDVVQETVIAVAKAIHKFKRDRGLGTFKGWLRNIIRWRIADQLSKRLPSREAPGSPGTASTEIVLEQIADPSGFSLDSVWEEEWQENLLKAATDRVKRRVKEEQYQMFDLYVMKKWPLAKVAKTLGVSPGQVYLAKHRVGNLIKKQIRALEKKGF